MFSFFALALIISESDSDVRQRDHSETDVMVAKNLHPESAEGGAQAVIKI